MTSTNCDHTLEPGHAKTGLKIFVIVIPNEALAGDPLAQPCFAKAMRSIKRRVGDWFQAVLA